MSSTYEKEIMEYGLEGLVIGSIAIATSELTNAVFKISKPTMNFNMENIAKVVGYTTVGVIIYDYAVKYKWIKPL